MCIHPKIVKKYHCTAGDTPEIAPQSRPSPKTGPNCTPGALDTIFVQHFAQRFRKWPPEGSETRPDSRNSTPNPGRLKKRLKLHAGSSRCHFCAAFRAVVPKMATRGPETSPDPRNLTSKQAGTENGPKLDAKSSRHHFCAAFRA